MNRRCKGYISDDEGYSEESFIGFIIDYLMIKVKDIKNVIRY